MSNRIQADADKRLWGCGKSSKALKKETEARGQSDVKTFNKATVNEADGVRPKTDVQENATEESRRVQPRTPHLRSPGSQRREEGDSVVGGGLSSPRGWGDEEPWTPRR